MKGREKAEAAGPHAAGDIVANEIRADVRMDGVYFFRSSANYPFSKKLDAGDFSYCFMVRRGELRLTIDFPEPRVIDLKPGAIVGVSGLAPHQIHSVPDMEALPVDGFERIPITEEIEPGKDVELLLGVVPSENIALTNLIIGPLYLSRETSPDFTHRIWKAAELLDEEFIGAGLEYGQAIIVRRIAEIILINMTRSLLVAGGEADAREPGPIRNRGVLSAIRAFLNDPLEDWSIDRLAKHAGMSRTKFAEDFRRVVGRTPMQTLARLRLTLVTRKMLIDDLSVEEAADMAGYSSAAAFIRAFAREYGATPHQWRKMRMSRVDADRPGG